VGCKARNARYTPLGWGLDTADASNTSRSRAYGCSTDGRCCLSGSTARLLEGPSTHCVQRAVQPMQAVQPSRCMRHDQWCSQCKLCGAALVGRGSAGHVSLSDIELEGCTACIGCAARCTRGATRVAGKETRACSGARRLRHAPEQGSAVLQAVVQTNEVSTSFPRVLRVTRIK